MACQPAPALPGFEWYRRRAMLDIAYNKVVHREFATTAKEFEAVLAYLPHGVRFGVAHQLDETGEAHRYECSRHCAYYLYRQEHGIEIWRWSYIVSEHEAGRLRALIASLGRPLDAVLADRVFEHATRRSVNNPRPSGAPFYALDFGTYSRAHPQDAPRPGIPSSAA
jgi:hypothetical protein